MTNEELLSKADRFWFGETKEYPHYNVWVVKRVGKERATEANKGWAVSNGSSVYTTERDWEYEPIPSYRDDDFFRRARYTLEEAAEIAQKLVDG